MHVSHSPGDLYQQIHFNWQMIWAYLKAIVLNLQDKKGSMKVIDEHYQLGNDLYRNMLDSSMGYSCGYWKNAKTLYDAQTAKYDLICRKLGLKPGMSVLKIGCALEGLQNMQQNVMGLMSLVLPCQQIRQNLLVRHVWAFLLRSAFKVTEMLLRRLIESWKLGCSSTWDLETTGHSWKLSTGV